MRVWCFIRLVRLSGLLAAVMLVSCVAQSPQAQSDYVTDYYEALAAYERSDVCALAACSTIVESVVAFTVAQALIDKFGGDSLVEMRARYDKFLELARGR